MSAGLRWSAQLIVDKIRMAKHPLEVVRGHVGIMLHAFKLCNYLAALALALCCPPPRVFRVQLFMDLGANDAQCDFPVVYASGVKGIAGNSPEGMAEDLQPLFEMIVNQVKGAQGRMMRQGPGLKQERVYERTLRGHSWDAQCT